MFRCQRGLIRNFTTTAVGTAESNARRYYLGWGVQWWVVLMGAASVHEASPSTSSRRTQSFPWKTSTVSTLKIPGAEGWTMLASGPPVNKIETTRRRPSPRAINGNLDSFTITQAAASHYTSGGLALFELTQFLSISKPRNGSRHISQLHSDCATITKRFKFGWLRLNACQDGKLL